MGKVGCDIWEKWVGGRNSKKKESNAEIWGKGVCDIWEKWVSGWRNKIPVRNRSIRPDKIGELLGLEVRESLLRLDGHHSEEVNVAVLEPCIRPDRIRELLLLEVAEPLCDHLGDRPQ